MTLGERVTKYERLVLLSELQRDHVKRKNMACALGISERTLYYKLGKHHLLEMSSRKAREVYLGSLSDD